MEIKATGLPETVEDYQVALNAAFEGGKAYGKAQRTFVGLTEVEINEVLGGDIRDEPSGLLEFVQAIEAKLNEKNT